jgi:hypothetical protein
MTSGTAAETGADARAGRGRRLAVTALWVLAVLATVLNGVVVGYGAIWFQLFGDGPDAADYRLSAAGYGTAALVLALAVPALLVSTVPRWLAPTAGVSAVLLGVMAMGSAITSVDEDPARLGTDDPWGDVLEGIGGVLWAPWTWVVVVLGLRALVLWAARRRPRWVAGDR